MVNQQNHNPPEEHQQHTCQGNSTNQSSSIGHVTQNPTNQIDPNNPYSEFQNQVANLQLEARENLIR